MLTKISKILKQLMEEKGVTTSELSRLTGVVQPVIYRIASGETDNPKVATLIPLANYFGITISQLIGEETLLSKINDCQRITNIKSGSTQIALLEWESLMNSPYAPTAENYIEVSYELSKNAFALKAKDLTMSPLFPIGTLLIFDPNVKAENQDFILSNICNQEEAVFRQMLVDRNDIYLKPLNSDFRTIFIDGVDNFKILGTLIESKIYFKNIINSI
jgi:transcriptional regulator with XRE-family HTH domain